MKNNKGERRCRRLATLVYRVAEIHWRRDGSPPRAVFQVRHGQETTAFEADLEAPHRPGWLAMLKRHQPAAFVHPDAAKGLNAIAAAIAKNYPPAEFFGDGPEQAWNN
jgi:hypothetical protein